MVYLKKPASKMTISITVQEYLITHCIQNFVKGIQLNTAMRISASFNSMCHGNRTKMMITMKTGPDELT